MVRELSSNKTFTYTFTYTNPLVTAITKKFLIVNFLVKHRKVQNLFLTFFFFFYYSLYLVSLQFSKKQDRYNIHCTTKVTTYVCYNLFTNLKHPYVRIKCRKQIQLWNEKLITPMAFTIF